MIDYYAKGLEERRSELVDKFSRACDTNKFLGKLVRKYGYENVKNEFFYKYAKRTFVKKSERYSPNGYEDAKHWMSFKFDQYVESVCHYSEMTKKAKDYEIESILMDLLGRCPIIHGHILSQLIYRDDSVFSNPTWIRAAEAKKLLKMSLHDFCAVVYEYVIDLRYTRIKNKVVIYVDLDQLTAFREGKLEKDILRGPRWIDQKYIDRIYGKQQRSAS
jgi:hypothetical protein